MQKLAVRTLAATAVLALPLTSPLFPSLQAQQLQPTAESSPVKPTPLAASAPTSVPALLPYSGYGTGADGRPISGEVPVTFLIFKQETGGEPLFIESQTAAFDHTGHFEVQLGATLSSGIPIDLFGTGEARWLEVQVAGARVQPRALLVSVPYALKAGDASTLGGLPASAYALAASGTTASTAIQAGTGIHPDTVTNVTTTGGTSGYLPVFTGSSTIANSLVFQTSTGVGIGDTPNSKYKLDVNGATIFRGAATIANTSGATASTGYGSYPLGLYASVYNSSTSAKVNPIFYWEAEPSGNNTTAPSATMNLLYNSNLGTGAETGLHFNSNGIITFAPGQTFTATGSTVAFNGTSTSGLGVEGTSSSGTGVQGSSTYGAGVQGTTSFGYGLKGVTTGTVDTAGVYGVAGTGNTSFFTAIAGVWGDAKAQIGVLGTSTSQSGVVGQSSASNGVFGASYGSSAGVKGVGYQGDGGNFSGGHGSGSDDGGPDNNGGNGVIGVGGTSSLNEYAPGKGGMFTGGILGHNATGATTIAGTGVEGVGGDDASDDGYEAGSGVVGYGGFSENHGTGGDGADFYAGYDDTVGGTAIYAKGQPNGSSDGNAAYFQGDVVITGALSHSSANTQIDHPLDPTNKYLSHASVGSSEMLNLYSGNIITDEQGLATVQLPKWFQAVNTDLRYQLTMIGHKGQAWISQEVKDGSFQIASDAANAKISWQLTGVRQDAYAKAHPLIVEQEKNARERGFYKHPTLYGQPLEKQSEWGRHPGMMRAAQLAMAKNKKALQPAK